MKETAIIMSGDHPRLILEGRKTMTRRVIKPRKWSRSGDAFMSFATGKPSMADIQYEAAHPEKPNLPCPYGGVGDRLWVKETWATMRLHDNIPPRDINPFTAPPLWYQADKPTPEDTNCNPWPEGNIGKWRPSIFMPKWASRIPLEITELRAERLRAITLSDAIREGYNTVEEFIEVFLNLNHLPDDANPWVWPISFMRMRSLYLA